MKLHERLLIAATFAVQAASLIVAASRNRHMLNPDAVSYLQVARHLLRGEFGLAVNGYWGPLISWIALPFLALTHDPLVAARCAMAISALIFSAGAFVYFRRSKLPFAAIWIATATCAAVAIFWSVLEITPDLLADGFLLAGFGGICGSEWLRDRSIQRASGLLLGIAYLGKAVMLPVGIATLLAISLHHALRHRQGVLRAAGRTLVFLAIVAVPWIAVLSVHYGKPLFSTAGPIAHALVGPPDADRRNPLILSFHRPHSGRVTDSEDPNAAAFRNWSPLASRAYFEWQMKTIRENATEIWHLVDGLAALHAAPIALGLALLWAIARPKRVEDAPSLVAATPLVIAAAMYAPVFADSRRYYIFAYALILGAAAAIGESLPRGRVLSVLTTAIAAAAILLPARTEIRSAFTQLPNRCSSSAIDLAHRMRRSGTVGPIAGTAPVEGGMGGLYTAFLLDVPWCGDEPQPRLATLRASGARYWILGTDDRGKLQSIPDAATRNVTAVLYGDAEPPPFIVREVIR